MPPGHLLQQSGLRNSCTNHKMSFFPFNPTGIQVNGHFQGQSIKQTHSETLPRGETYTTMAACLEEDIVIIDTGNKEELIFHNTISKALLDLATCL